MGFRSLQQKHYNLVKKNSIALLTEMLSLVALLALVCLPASAAALIFLNLFVCADMCVLHLVGNT